jgi:subtilisin family serine protease
MKRSLSLILSLTMLLAVLYPCQSVIAAETERRSVTRFSSLVTEFNTEYELDSDSYEEKYNEDNPNASENRLIVQARSVKDDAGAVESMSGLEYTVLQYDDKQDMEAAYEQLTSEGYTVEKDRVLSVKDNSVKNLRTMADETEETEEVSQMWAYESVMSDYAITEIEQSSAADEEIVIGVLDSGLDYTHELFENRVVDTTFNMSESGNENDCMDDNGHGSAVAGVIALSTPENVKIKPYKVIDADGYVSLSVFTAAMETILASNDLPDIMNISLGGYLFEENMSIETELVERLVARGVTVCIASGNDNLPVEYCTPADCETAITVGAYDYTDHICSFSNYGEKVDVAAPGYDVYTYDFYTENHYTEQYYGQVGTSFACPFVSAACAYILMQNPGLSPEEVKEELKASAIDMGEDEHQYYGAGMLNFQNLIDNKEYKTPQPSIKGGFYNDTQTVTFADIPAGTQLVYTLDKSIPSSTNGTVYTEPITIDNEMQLTFVLIKDGKYASNISSQYYTIQYYMDESYFTINDSGVITSYTGDKNNIIVPDTINGIVPLNINADDMEGSKLTAVVLPDSVERIQNTFRDCAELKYVTAKGVTRIDAAFRNCYSLRTASMPKLSLINSRAFSMCSMMHDIDFEESVETALGGTFEYTGLLEVSFPKLYIKNSPREIFRNTPLLKCDIPLAERLAATFRECYFLQELNAPNLKRVDGFTFADCWFLTEMDFPSLETIEPNAFAYCYIDVLYAPKLTTYSNLGGGYGIVLQAFTRVIDFPALTEMPTYFLMSSYVEEVYLENVVDVPVFGMLNLPYLNVVYMPLATQFDITSDRHWQLPGVGPMEIIWVPSAKETTRGTYPSTMKLFYGPSIESIYLSAYDSVFVLSEKATNMGIQATQDGGQAGKFPTIIAPYGSAAYQWVQHENRNTERFKFIDSDSMGESLGGQIRTRDSGLRFGFIFDEANLGFDIREYENLYSRISKEYGFVYTYDDVSEDEQEANTQVRNGTDGAYTIEATKRDVNGTVSQYNAVFTGIPASHYDSRISARAYICIDGMYFYSPVTTRSFNDVANAIVNDDTMDQNTRSEVYNLINREV